MKDTFCLMQDIIFLSDFPVFFSGWTVGITCLFLGSIDFLGSLEFLISLDFLDHLIFFFFYWISLILYITKTDLYSLYPLKPHLYIVKLGFTGVYIIFLFLLKNIDCGYSLELPRRGSSNYPQSMFWAEIRKMLAFFICKFSIFGVKFFNIF